jgi:hypothetical protein
MENGEYTLQPTNIKQLKGKEGQATNVMLREYMAGEEYAYVITDAHII